MRSRGERNDRVTQYAAWQALREIATPDVLRALLKDERGAVRRAALLALLESRALEPADVKPLVRDRDAGTSGLPPTGWRSRMATRSSTSIRGPATSSTP